MDVLQLEGQTPRELGEAHGRPWGTRIRALAAVRWEMLALRSPLRTRADLERLAARHVECLARTWPDLAEEMAATAAAAGVRPADLAVLNAYTDMRDVDERALDEGGCTVVFAPTSTGPVLGQTWDTHASACPFVGLLHVAAPGKPRAVLLTIAGCFGMAGLNEHGVGVCINNLTPTDARVGLLWPAVVRRMLEQPTADGALAVLKAARLGSGHSYLVADPRRFYCVETTGRRLRVLTADPTRPTCHTNHYLHPDLLPWAATRPAQSTTLERLARARTLLGKARLERPDDLCMVLADHAGGRGSLCVHRSDVTDAHGVQTNAAVVMDLAGRRLLASRGCVAQGRFHEEVVA